MDLFYASRRSFSVGELVSATVRTVSNERAAFEALFSAYAPAGAPDRMVSLFASDDPAFAAKYLVAEGAASARLYRVRSHGGAHPHGDPHPMVLVDFAFRNAGPGKFPNIAREYWSPTFEWRCREYLCASFEILESLPMPDSNDLAGAAYRYVEDWSTAARRWR